MGVLQAIVIVVGLMLFEVVSSIDNAIINAEVLANTSQLAKRWFLTWGLLLSVVAVRGLMPLVIVYVSSPSLGWRGALTAAFSASPETARLIKAGQATLLAGGGLYVLLLSLHWLFLEAKSSLFRFEELLYERYGIWFYALASIILVGIVCLAGHERSGLVLGAVIGSSAFFVTNGFKSKAEVTEIELKESRGSDWTKILYLELIDTAFSIDGVLGAFAFTTAVPLILLGNGLGALVIRQLTMKGLRVIKRYRYLANGAMYSMGALGIVMLVDSFGAEIPFWVSPAITVALASFFFHKSHLELPRVYT